MAINVTRWSPDTCGCEIEFEWDSTLPAEQRVHTSKTIVKACPAHDGLKVDKHNHFAKVLNENQRKNKFDAQLKTISQMVDTNTDGTVQYKNGMGFNYSWSGTGENRVLNISVYGYALTNQQRNALQNWCETNLGAGKLVIA